MHDVNPMLGGHVTSDSSDKHISWVNPIQELGFRVFTGLMQRLGDAGLAVTNPCPAFSVGKLGRSYKTTRSPNLICAGSPVSASRRQKFFRNPENRKRAFSQEHVWTFCIYQSQVNMSTYQLDVGLKFDLCRHLDGQPMQFMLKDRSTT